jgi:type VI secretion system secreted protein VgrG
MIQRATQITRPLALFTPLGPDKLLLRRLDGREEISRLFQYDLELLSDDEAIEPTKILGRKVTVQIRRNGAAPRYFNGFVSQFVRLGRSELAVAYQARVVPWLWFLTRTADCRIFQNRTTPQIIEQIFRDLGFSEFDLTGLKGRYVPREYCVQYRETDFDFVSRLMEEEGISYFFRHENGRHTLVLADHPAAYFEIDDRHVGTGQGDGTTRHVDQLTEWEHGYQYCSGRYAQTDYNFRTPQRNLMSREPGIVRLPNNRALEIYDYPGRFGDADLSRERTRIRMEACEAEYDQVTGTATYGSFTPGGRFTVRRHPSRAELGRSYVLTAVQHTASVNSTYLTGPKQDEIDFQVRFTCIPAEVPLRPASVTNKPTVHGPQTATVVGPRGEQIYTDEYGRVKVQFHWDREGQRDENSSCWLRVSQKHAGKGWGDMDLPRIGEEVIVGFLDGDPDRPIIKGRVYNGANEAPFPLPGGMTRSGGKSNTHQGSGYNEITLDDTDGQQQIRINAQHNMDTVIGNNQTEQVGVDRSTDIGNDDTLTIAVDGSLEIGNDCQVTVGNDATYVVGNDVVIRAGTAITLACGASTVHMNQAGVITISGTFVSSAARANHAIVAPLTQIVGSNMLLQAGLVVLDLGAVTHVKGGETAVSGARVKINGSGETLLMGMPLMLGEVGAPLAGLPEGQGGDGSDAEAGTGAGAGGDGADSGQTDEGGETVPGDPQAEQATNTAAEESIGPSETTTDTPAESGTTEEHSIEQRRTEISEELMRDDLSEERRVELLDELNEIDRSHALPDNESIPHRPESFEVEDVAPPAEEPQPTDDPADQRDIKTGAKASASLGKKGGEADVSVYAEEKISESERDLGIFTANHERTARVEMGAGTEGGKVTGSVEDKVSLTNRLGDELYCKAGGNADSQGGVSGSAECGLSAAIDEKRNVSVAVRRETSPKIVSSEIKEDDSGGRAIEVCISVPKLGAACVEYERKSDASE